MVGKRTPRLSPSGSFGQQEGMMASEHGQEASRIANTIVDLVERTDGAVTLREVERKVPGFVAQGSLWWDATAN